MSGDLCGGGATCTIARPPPQIMAYPRWFNHIQLASYSQQALLLVSGGAESWSNYGNLIEDVRVLLVRVGVTDVLFQPRQGKWSVTLSCSIWFARRQVFLIRINTIVAFI
ncbi:hypothetical protein Pyn_02631 [Prunus yedoensis var. nudiflora]|uniref:Uncharacterized protein n=1 Tax=Prunus yedoensis var. nudiflora TaxID=2094558 RepID=A0A314UWZ0_PRUYE|nr:hypothetical protein Pyn_02631 [Prunus yedoensis var. nudiflora]